VTAAKPLNVTMQVDSHAGMKTVLKPDPGLKAPVQQGQKVGVLWDPEHTFVITDTREVPTLEEQL